MKAIRNVLLSLVTIFSATTSATLITDVQEYDNNLSNEYFVIDDASKNTHPYYRGSNQDWGWIHEAIAGTFTSVVLDISAFDVDAPAELDLISVFDGSSWVSLGNLVGLNDQWGFTNFDLSSFSWAGAQVNAGLQVKMDIDTAAGGWIVTLGKAVLTVDDGSGIGGGGSTCVPTPGIPCTVNVPEPSTLMIFALALLGLQTRKKFIAK